MGLGITGAGSPGQAVREVEVKRCMSEVRHHAERLRETANTIRDRFAVALRNEPPTAGQVEQVKTPPVSAPLALELASVADILDNAQDILQDALQRCEL